ncbi:hypothetical protein PYW07_017125 [Mythimna separata]|uniref:Uncharacterized protein n=1 Tax=Mythimna separata TaxID=271217 RepID=A0AAD7YXG9_MYTSE|nr:hypothetical protein PYW07_017125 [Mythimna separata]
MSEYYKEQHPLLCEEVSEDDHFSPRYHRRLRSSTNRGRVRSNLKGAASILTRWPDHWSSFLAYWWVGIGMISLTTFIIYNTMFAFAILPTANLKPTSLILTNNNGILLPRTLPDVFMHVFVKQYDDIDFNEYMPYIKEISNKYDNIKYHLIIVANDTNLGWLSAEENNEIALNSLWNKDPKKEPSQSNIAIEYVSLSAYMENSPLRKYWQTLPCHLMEFLARAVSIWDKGGIAFDPIILTPRSQHTIYKEKIHKLLNKYAGIKTGNAFKIKKPNKTGKKERKLNNIRDIINALETEDESANAFSQQTLTEAENVLSPIVTRTRRSLTTTTDIKKEVDKNTDSLNIHSLTNSSNEGNTKEEKGDNFGVNNSTESAIALDASRNITKLSLLPLFLDFIFHNKLKVKQSSTEATANRTRRRVVEVSKSEDIKDIITVPTHALDSIERKIPDYKPVIISAVGIYNKSEYNKSLTVNPSEDTDNISEKNRLTIDLRGNIIATDTACHAFLGTIFSNAVHHSAEESVTDFIIAELTIFCKGLLSSCMGIDLILL